MEFLWVVGLYSFPGDFWKGYKCHEKSHKIFKQVKGVKVKAELSPELLNAQEPYINPNSVHLAGPQFVLKWKYK